MDAAMVKEEAVEKAAVHEAVQAWLQCVEAKDMDLFARAVAQDGNLVWIGSGVSDRLAGFDALKQALEAQNAALDDIRITVSDEIIYLLAGKRSAFAVNQWVFTARAGDQTIEIPLRCTWVVEKRRSGWVIVHFHKSMGVPE